jgi:oligosaccharyltransferase complex subunit beta
MATVKILFICLLLVAQGLALSQASPAKKRTLVLLDNASFYLTHSQFLKIFSELDHSHKVELVSIKMITEGLIRLEVDKEMQYDNIIFMAGSLPELPEMTGFNLPRFFEKGGNIFFIIDNDLSPFFREYFKKFGFSVDRPGSYLVDYEKAVDPSQPQLFKVTNFKDHSFLAENVKGPLLYSGMGLETTIFENSQMTVFARGGSTTASVVYETHGKRTYSKLSKNNILLLGIQGLQQGRIIVSGSLDMFSNRIFELSKGENRAYSRNLVEWLSNERAYVRQVGYHFTCLDWEGNPSEDCRKKFKFRFNTDLESWNWNTKKWQPYSDDNINLELTMMTPKLRKLLEESPTKKGHYSITGHIPNRMGTYRLKISHTRPGWNRIWLYKKVQARYTNHLERPRNWARDLVATVGIIIVLTSFALVSYIFLYNDDRVKLIN